MTMIRVLMRCPLWWFDKTPTGRIINRTIKDQNVVDMELPDILAMTIRISSAVLGSLIVVGVITPYFFILVAVLGIFYGYWYSHSIQVCMPLQFEIHS